MHQIYTGRTILLSEILEKRLSICATQNKTVAATISPALNGVEEKRL